MTVASKQHLNPAITDRDEFWVRRRTTLADDTGCWLWSKALTDDGYGRLEYCKRKWLAHRFVYELLVGPIPDGLELDHRCRNRACVNPAHLDPVTKRVNWERGESYTRKLAAQSHCKRGHEFTPENTAVTSQGNRECRSCRQVHADRRRKREREFSLDELARFRARKRETQRAIRARQQASDPDGFAQRSRESKRAWVARRREAGRTVR